MKKTYFTPITKPISIPAEDLMIPSLYGPSGQENHPLDPNSLKNLVPIYTLYV